MQRRRIPSVPRQAGFTLLEMIVVLVIIGLIMGLVGPRLFGQADKAKVQTAETQIKMLRGALQTNVNGANLIDVRLSGAGVTDRLLPGSIFTSEPGLYYPSRGMGVRITEYSIASVPAPAGRPVRMRPGATASSRSTITPSTPSAAPFSILRRSSPGMNSSVKRCSAAGCTDSSWP